MNAVSKIEAATLSGAMAAAFSEIEGATKSANNPHFKSKYADLGSVWNACREALAANGLSIVQLPGFDNGVVQLTTIVLVDARGRHTQSDAVLRILVHVDRKSVV